VKTWILAALIALTAAAQPREMTNSAGMKLVRIDAGEFTMGSDGSPLPAALATKPHFKNGDFDEQPAHRVRVSRPFWIGAYEVTNAQYEQFDPKHRELRGKRGFSKNDDEAVVFVSWREAVAFCQWLSRKEGGNYRLPTEAEWEYAARASKQTRYWWGDDIGQNNAVCPSCGSQWDGKQTAPVGSFRANAFGLHDTAGNVWEWTQDCWHDNYNNAPNDGSVWLEKDGGDCKSRVVRGGSWGYLPRGVRSAARGRDVADVAGNYLGFRIARDF